LSRFIHNREFRPSGAEIQGADRASRKDREAQVKPLRPDGGFKLVFQSRYLLFIALLIGIYTFINMTGEYIITDVSTRVALRAVESGTAARSSSCPRSPSGDMDTSLSGLPSCS
jgi:hypothetical protein